MYLIVWEFWASACILKFTLCLCIYFFPNVCFFEEHSHSFGGSHINLNPELTNHNLCPKVCLYQIALLHKSMFNMESDFYK